MNFMRTAATTFLSLSLFLVPAFSQTMVYNYISGTVSYENGSPVVGATATLIGAQKNGITGATGIFYLTGYIPVNAVEKNRNSILAMAQVINSVLRFSVHNRDEKVKIEMFNMNGRRISVPVDAVAAPGDYSVPLNGLALAGQVCILKLTIGSNSEMFKMSLVKSMHQGALFAEKTGTRSVRLLKKAAFHDTVMVSMAGSPSQKKPVDSLVAALVFVLQNPAGAGGGTDASLSTLPLVVPLTQISYGRYGGYSYTTIAQPMPYTPVFNADSSNYAVSGNFTIVGIKPRAAAAGSKISVTVDNAPCGLVPWWTTGLYILDSYYTCTLSTAGQTKIFATTVTAADNVTKKTYSLTVKR